MKSGGGFMPVTYLVVTRHLSWKTSPEVSICTSISGPDCRRTEILFCKRLPQLVSKSRKGKETLFVTQLNHFNKPRAKVVI